MEFRAIHLSKYSQGIVAVCAAGGDFLGTAASAGLRGTGARASDVGAGHEAEVAVCYRSGLELVAGVVGAGDGDGSRGAAENLEQHADRNEPRAAPAIVAESAHGCAVEPDQSTFLI